jgi:hypothetical protein
MSGHKIVRAWKEDVVIPTSPDKNPMFLEKRVYQGSSGKVYPLPFTDRIAEKPVDRNGKRSGSKMNFIRAMVLPESAGASTSMQDKTNGYDLIYNQPSSNPRWWAGRAVDFRRHRVQLAAASSPRDVPAGGF